MRCVVGAQERVGSQPGAASAGFGLSAPVLLIDLNAPSQTLPMHIKNTCSINTLVPATPHQGRPGQPASMVQSSVSSSERRRWRRQDRATLWELQRQSQPSAGTDSPNSQVLLLQRGEALGQQVVAQRADRDGGGLLALGLAGGASSHLEYAKDVGSGLRGLPWRSQQPPARWAQALRAAPAAGDQHQHTATAATCIPVNGSFCHSCEWLIRLVN